MIDITNDLRIDEFFDFLESAEGSQTLDLFLSGNMTADVMNYLSSKYGPNIEHLLSQIGERLFFQRGNHLHNG